MHIGNEKGFSQSRKTSQGRNFWLYWENVHEIHDDENVKLNSKLCFWEQTLVERPPKAQKDFRPTNVNRISSAL